MPLLRVEHLAKHFASPSGRLEVLRDVSFTLEAGEFLAIVGESGSGKSTMLQTIGTLEPADAGEVYLAGEPILGLNAKRQAELRNRHIGFVYQAHHLIPELTALENVMLPLLVRGDTEQKARERARALLSALRLGARMEHIPARLSGGEAQRVAVARALATQPKLVLADEPTGNLDEGTAAQVFAMFREICSQERAAVVMVTHSLPLARRCDRMLRLHQGVLEEVSL
ncbi:MAG: ABC transporter ATP-binding protein [Zetaproteobacteria bacterium]|nr:MAG: ABC transporter ATP-binding protein [Zetaproteobacteria bacterium]